MSELIERARRTDEREGAEGSGRREVPTVEHARSGAVSR
jgi:hypothetical protein